jgi:hypothetical protein
MNAVVNHGACTEIVRQLYRAYTVYELRFYESLRFQHSVNVKRMPCKSCGKAKIAVEAQSES